MARPTLPAICLMLACWLPTRAEPVFPRGSSLGLEPPPGFTPSTRFIGFEGPNRASIELNELSGADLATLRQRLPPQDAARYGVVERERRDFRLNSGEVAMLIRGDSRSRANGQMVRLEHWSLMAQGPGGVGWVKVVLPATDATPRMRGAIERSLASLVLRAPDTAALRNALPFRFAETASLRMSNAAGGSVAFLAPPGVSVGTVEGLREPRMVIGVSTQQQTMPADGEAGLARAMLQRVIGGPVDAPHPSQARQVAGRPAAFVQAQAPYGPERIPTRFALWFAVLADGRTLTVMAQAPTDRFDTAWPEFDAVVRSVALR
jgi:hypothetical protein